MRTPLCSVVALLALLLAAPAWAGKINAGEIVVGRGANGATLGMTRAEVVGALGTPLDENLNGVMSYQPSSSAAEGIFDVYRTDKTGPVRMFIISFPNNGKWTLDDGNKIFRRGAIQRLYDTYGDRVHKRTDVEDGSKNLFIRGRFHGRRVRTEFLVDRYSKTKGKVLDVFILYFD